MNTPQLPGYSVTGIIGAGGFGTVYKAKKHSTGQDVAIKLLKRSHLTDDRMRRHQERFERETTLCAKLTHPNIVRLIDKGEWTNQQIYAVFEYIPGITLRDRIRSPAPISAMEAANIMGQVLEGLVYAHDQGIVHRDLKPGNIMLSQYGAKTHVKILDYGIGAFTPDVRSIDYKTLTLTTEALGTPSYSAPEQLRGELPTIKADLYAWGLLLLECLTGSPAIQGDTLAECYHQQLSRQPVPIPAALISHPVASLLKKVLEKNLEQRAGDTRAILQEFSQINFLSLVGQLGDTPPKSQLDQPDDDATRADIRNYQGLVVEQKSISVLAVDVCAYSTTGAVSPEIIEPVQYRLMDRCREIARQMGGYEAGSLGSTMLFYFGYPYVSDSDTRRALQAGMLLVEDPNLNGLPQADSENIVGQVRAVLHRGPFVVAIDDEPSGYTAVTTMQLLRTLPSKTFWVSDTVKSVLSGKLPADESPEFSSRQSTDWGDIFLVQKESALQKPASNINFPHPMIGRESELKLLRQQWQQIDGQGGGSLVLISGDAGIGKSRLVHEFKVEVGGTTETISVCRCLPEHRNSALHPLFDLLQKEIDRIGPEAKYEALAEQLVQAGIELNDQIMALFCSWLGIDENRKDDNKIEPLSPDKQKKVIFTSLYQWLNKRSAGDKSLFIIEDLHWADPTTLEFLEEIKTEIHNSSLLVVATTRPQPNLMVQGVNIEVVALERLPQHAADQLVKQLLDSDTVDEASLAKIRKQTEGMPLYTEEFVKMLVEGGTLKKTNGIYSLQSNINSANIPLTLQDSLAERLDRLGPAKELAQIASAIGREFDEEVIKALDEYDHTGLAMQIKPLIDAELVYPEENDHSRYIFRHALIRDAAYDSMLPSTRKSVHRRIAEVLEQQFYNQVSDNPENLAWHYAKSESYEKAVELALLAAEQSLAKSVNKETIAIGRQALEWNAERKDELKRAETELAINDILFPALMAVEGLGSADLIAVSKRSIELTHTLSGESPEDTIQSTNATFIARWSEFQDLHFRCESKAAIEIGEKLVEQARKDGDRIQELVVLPLLGQAYHWYGDIKTAIERCRQALAIYREDEDGELWKTYGGEPKSQALFILSHALTCQGLTESADEANDESLSWAQKVGCEFKVDGATFFQFFMAYLKADKEKVKALAAAHLDLSKPPSEERWLLAHSRCIYDWAIDSTAFIAPFIEAQLGSGRTGAICWQECIAAEIEIANGLLDEADERLRESISRSESAGDFSILPLLIRNQAIVCYRRSADMATVDSLFERGINMARNIEALWYELDLQLHYVEILFEQENRRDKLMENSAKLQTLLGRLKEGDHTPLVQRCRQLLKRVEEGAFAA